MTLKIYLLGQFKLQQDDQPIELPSRPAQSLLAYLAINAGVPHRREKLAGLLWPDSTEENARGYLRQALWRIKKSLEEHDLQAEDYLDSDKINISFNAEADYWLDTQELLRKTDSLSPEELSSILMQYQGELLPGFYDEWVSPERERFQAVFQQKIAHLIQELIGDQSWDDVLTWAEVWIRLAPVPEAAFRASMRAYAASGDQAMLISTFERCHQALEHDLGVEVSPETKALYDKLTKDFQSRVNVEPGNEPDVTTTRPAFLDSPGIPPTETPLFVARQAEMQMLSNHLEQTLAGDGKVVFVTGDAGSGKTALLNSFTQSALDRHPDLLVASGSCNAQTGVGDPYLPMREVLEMLSGDVESRLQAGSITREQALRLWHQFPRTLEALVDLGPDLVGAFVSEDTLLPRARDQEAVSSSVRERLHKLVEQRAPVLYSTGIQQLSFFDQYTRVIRGLASAAPLVLILDDLQWADRGSIGLLFHMGREIAGSRILVVGSFRQEEVALGRGDERHPLEPVVNEFQRLFGSRSIDVGTANSQDFLDEFLDSEPNELGAAFREMLYRLTQGHALFTTELMRKMQESGELIRDDHGLWREGSALDWERMPARVEAVVAERIRRLPPPEQAILRAASVEGEVFTAEILAEVLEIRESELMSLLSADLDRNHRLVRAESIQRIGDQLISSYRFRHTLFQKYLYSTLDDIERVHLHQAFGIATERLLSDQPVPTVNSLQLARHFENAGMIEKAIDYLHQAGDRAIQISGNAEGISHLSKALVLLENQPPSLNRDEKELAVQLSIAMSWKYNWEAMAESMTIDRIRDLRIKLNKRSPLARTLNEQSTRLYVQADYQQAFSSAHECLQLAEQEQDPLLLAEAHWLLGVINFSTANFIPALELLDKVNSFYNPRDHHDQLIHIRGVDAGLSAASYRACCLWCLGYPDQALELSLETLVLARQFGHAFTLADVLSFAGCLLFALVGDANSLAATAEDLATLSESANLSLAGWVSMGEYYLGEALTLQGEFEQAIPLIEGSLETSQSNEVKLYRSMAFRFLAAALLEAGETDAALENVKQALLFVNKTGENLWKADLLRIRARAMRSMDEKKAAYSDLEEALALTRTQQAKSWELRVSIDLARMLSEDGKLDQAKALLSDCYAWFNEGHDTPDHIKARTLLDSFA